MNDEYKKKIEVVESQMSMINTTCILWFLSLFMIWSLSLIASYYYWQNYAGSDKQIIEYVSLKEQAKNVKFKLPGVEFEVASVFAPTVWNWAMFLFLLYLVQSRKRVLIYIARAIRFRKAHCEDSSSQLHIMPPWWLAPLPNKTTNHVYDEEVKSFLSWGPTQGGFRVRVIIFCACIMLMQSHVAWLAWTASDIFIRGGWNIAVMPSLSFLSVIFSGYLVMVWFRDTAIPAYDFSEKVPKQVTRRDLIKFGILSVLALTVAPTMEMFRKFNRPKFPRFLVRKTRKPITVNLKPGFFRNKRKGGNGKVVHIVSNESDMYIFGDDKPKIENFIPIKPDDLVTTDGIIQFNGSKGISQLEKFVLQGINGGQLDYKLAIDLLIVGMKYDNASRPTSTGRPSYRIYDLAAGLAVRHEQPSKLKEITQITDSSSDNRLRRKRLKWDKEKSEWREKWSSNNKELTWAGLPM